MKRLKIAYSDKALEIFGAIPSRETVNVNDTDFTDVGAVVITDTDTDVLKKEMIFAFTIPVLLIRTKEGPVADDVISRVYRVIDLNETDHDFYSRQIESAASHYEEKVLPPFFKDLENTWKTDTPSLTAQAIRAALSSASTRQAVHSMISSAKIPSALICATLM